MLESDRLILRPWALAPKTRRFAHVRDERGRRTRAIIDTATRHALGFASWRPGALVRGVTRPWIEVYETEDASFVFAARRRWWWPSPWDVTDADGRYLGAIRAIKAERAGEHSAFVPRIAISDAMNHCATWVERSDVGAGEIVASSGAVLARMTRAGLARETEVHFVPESNTNPFVRMLVLAALLAHGW